MPERQLILHIGLGKCGTSSLQAFLAINAEKLRSVGYYYPELEPLGGARSGQITSGNGALLARSLLEEGHFFYAGAKTERMDLLEARVRLGTDNSVVLSSEFFSMLNEDQAGGFIDCLNSWGMRVTVVCYVRRQDHMALSNYVQGLIAGHSSVGRSFEEEVFEVSKRFRYSNLLKPWIRPGELNRLEIRAFERSKLLNGDVVSDFLSVLGLAELHNEFAGTEALNESLNAVSAYLLYLIRKRYPEEPAMPQFIKALKSLEWKKSSRNECLLGAEARRRIVALFEEDNQLVAKTLAGITGNGLFETVVEVADAQSQPCVPSLEDALPLIQHLRKHYRD